MARGCESFLGRRERPWPMRCTPVATAA